uniref:Uncharacterized protein n=1 Tax=Pyrodinium bahamense TaxID=73915 RepID=A0A7S0ASL0_9DINO
MEEYKFYFDKLRRWRAGGNRFFNIGPGTGNKPLLVYIDIGSDDPAQPVNDVQGMGAAFHFPEDLDHYRTGTPKGGSKCNGCCKADREPGYNCATREGCTYAGGQAFWPQGYGTKPSVIEADTGPKFVIAQWKIHGTSSGTACFSGKRDLRGQPFAGASMIFMWSCSSSKYTVFNLGSVVTALEFGLNSLGVAPSGAAQEPWLFAQLLREGKAAGEALVGWWHGHGRTQGSQDGFGQAGIVLYGDPMVKYGALVDWEAHRIRRANENATRNMTKQDEKEDSAFLQEGEEEEDEEADAEEEAADAARYDAALNGQSGSQV